MNIINNCVNDKYFNIDWGAFGLIEFLLSEEKRITEQTNALDIGSDAGFHTQIMRAFGIKVDQIDKYAEKAEIKDDFLNYKFNKKYDIVFCSHVIEHQRNIGIFLDKIFDILTDKGILIISAPKHETSQFVEGHLSCWHLTFFLQNLIHAGFDCKLGKILSIAGIENTFIVPKAINYDYLERTEAGFIWKDIHQLRSPVKLVQGLKIENQIAFFHNCEVLVPVNNNQKLNITFRKPVDYKDKKITIDISRHSNDFIFNI